MTTILIPENLVIPADPRHSCKSFVIPAQALSFLRKQESKYNDSVNQR